MPPGGVVSLIPQYRSYFLSMRQIVFSFEVHLCKYVYSVFFVFYFLHLFTEDFDTSHVKDCTVFSRQQSSRPR